MYIYAGYVIRVCLVTSTCISQLSCSNRMVSREAWRGMHDKFNEECVKFVSELCYMP
jgi:hypothetical protein